MQSALTKASDGDMQVISHMIFALVFLACGQILNVSVFSALGYDSVFYGHRHGRPSGPWVVGWPYFVKYPQYCGVTLSLIGAGHALIALFPSRGPCIALGALLGDALGHLGVVYMERTSEAELSKKA